VSRSIRLCDGDVRGAIQPCGRDESRTDRRKRTAGKGKLEAMRCLKRMISDAVYRQLIADTRKAKATQDRAVNADPGVHCGASLTSSAADSHPHLHFGSATSSRTRANDACYNLPEEHHSQEPSSVS
jgi:hypothetical protein